MRSQGERLILFYLKVVLEQLCKRYQFKINAVKRTKSYDVETYDSK